MYYTDELGMRHLDPVRFANSKRVVELLHKDAAGTISIEEELERRSLSRQLAEEEEAMKESPEDPPLTREAVDELARLDAMKHGGCTEL